MNASRVVSRGLVGDSDWAVIGISSGKKQMVTYRYRNDIDKLNLLCLFFLK